MFETYYEIEKYKILDTCYESKKRILKKYHPDSNQDQVVIPRDISIIKKGAFEGTTIKSISIHPSCVVEKNSFDNCCVEQIIKVPSWYIYQIESELKYNDTSLVLFESSNMISSSVLTGNHPFLLPLHKNVIVKLHFAKLMDGSILDNKTKAIWSTIDGWHLDESLRYIERLLDFDKDYDRYDRCVLKADVAYIASSEYPFLNLRSHYLSNYKEMLSLLAQISTSDLQCFIEQCIPIIGVSDAKEAEKYEQYY